MTEDEARARTEALVDVPRGTWNDIDRFIAYLRDEAQRQNLVSASTLDHIWERHLLDSVQLLAWDRPGHWLDLGTGAGFPGLIIAALRSGPTTLVESRRKRIAFLEGAVGLLGIGARTAIVGTRLEMMKVARHDVISARAFAPLDRLLAVAHPHSHDGTIWLLPKGQSAHSEVEAARRTWQGSFRVEPSLTDPVSGVVIAEHVRPRRQAGSRA